MQFKLLLFALLGMCMQNVAGNKKKQRNGRNRLITFGMGLLYLGSAIEQKPTTDAITCPTELPSYSLDMMNYIRCGDREQTSEFFEKYLTTMGETDLQKCEILSSLHQKAKQLGNCPAEKLTNIVNGAQQKLLGKTLAHKEEVNMFEEYLQNVDGTLLLRDVESLSKAFRENEKIGFFQIKEAADILVKHTKIEIGYALELVLNPAKQNLDFEKVERMMPYAKMITTKLVGSSERLNIENAPEQVKNVAICNTAMDPKFHKLDFDVVDHMMFYAEKIYAQCSNYSSDCQCQSFIARISRDRFNNVPANCDQIVKEWQAREALEPKHQETDVQKVDKLYKVLRSHVKMSHPDDFKELLKPEHHQLDLEKVNCAMSYAKKLNLYESDQIKEALQPKYQKYDFGKVDHMMKYAKKMHTGYDSSFFTLFGLIDSDGNHQAREALDMKYQNYNLDLVDTVYDGLVAAAPGSPEFALKEAFEPWIQKQNITNITKLLSQCKNAKNEESAKRCWVLKAKTKKSDL